MINKKDFIFSFILGGTVFTLITYFVNNSDPKIGSLILAAPKILIPTLIFFWYIKTPFEKVKKYIFNALPLIVLLLIWLSLFIFLIKILNIDKNNVSFLLLIITVTILYGVLYILYPFDKIMKFINY